MGGAEFLARALLSKSDAGVAGAAAVGVAVLEAVFALFFASGALANAAVAAEVGNAVGVGCAVGAGGAEVMAHGDADFDGAGVEAFEALGAVGGGIAFVGAKTGVAVFASSAGVGGLAGFAGVFAAAAGDVAGLVAGALGIVGAARKGRKWVVVVCVSVGVI